MENLARVFFSTSHPEQVKLAEEKLQELSSSPTFFRDVLDLLADDHIDSTTQLAASLYLKNWITNRWALEPEAPNALSDEAKQYLRCNLLRLVFNPKNDTIRIQNHIASIVQISDLDFPRQWVTFLSDILEVLNNSNGDVAVIVIGMNLINSALLKYRRLLKSEDHLSEIVFILDQLCPTLKNVFEHASSMIPMGTDEIARVKWMEVLDFCTNIHLTLHHYDLPEFFEENIAAFFNPFIHYLQECRLLEHGNDDLYPGLGQTLATSMMMAMKIYAERYEEEFQPFVDAVTKAVVERIRDDQRKSSDGMVMAGLEFLSAVSRRSWPSDPLAPIIEMICHHCLLPNFKLRDIDLEEMEDCPVDFIRADVDEAGIERRGVARALIKDLNRQYEENVLSTLNQNIIQLIQVSGSGATNADVHLEAAVNLVMAVAVKSSEREKGVVETSQLIDLGAFQAQHIFPIIADRAGRGCLAVMASLKFIYTFRNQMTDDVLVQTIERIAEILTDGDGIASTPDACVSKTYAAICMERLLNARQRKQTGIVISYSGELRLKNNPTVEASCIRVIQGLMPTMLINHEPILDNEHYAHLLENALFFLQDHIDSDILVQCTEIAVKIIKRIALKSVNPHFNHHIFEFVACAFQIAKAKDNGATVKNLEDQNVIAFAELAAMEDHDFLPYLYQLLAVLVEARPNDVECSPADRELFELSLDASRWAATQNLGQIRGLMQLLSAFFYRQHPSYTELITSKTGIICERLQTVFRNRKLFADGYRMVSGMFTCLPLPVLYPIVKDVFIMIVNNLQKHRTDVNVDNAFTLVSLYTIRLALEPTANPEASFRTIVNSVQNGIFGVLMEKVFVKSLESRFKESSRDALLAILGLCATLALGGLDQSEVLTIQIGIKSTLTSISTHQQVEKCADKGTTRVSTVRIEVESDEPIGGASGVNLNTLMDRSFVRLRHLPTPNDPKSVLVREIAPRIDQLLQSASSSAPDPTLWSAFQPDNPIWVELTSFAG